MKKYIIVGNGVAGTTAAENIRRNDSSGSITIVTEEEIPFYYRVRLPDYLCGEVSRSELIARKDDWYRENNITLRLSTKITGGSGTDRVLRSSSGEEFPYDRLLLANGSRPFIPEIQGSDKKNVFTLHYFQDAEKIIAQADCCKKAILIGGGLLGLEAGNGLKKRGLDITVVEFFPRLLPRQLDEEGAGRLQKLLEKRGFAFKLGAATRLISGDKKVEEVALENGESLNAEMVIISAGVKPNTALAGELGLDCSEGIRVNSRMQTSRPEIYAAGDNIEFEGKTYGIWPAAMEQGKVAGTNISGGDSVYRGTVLSNILKVANIDLASSGEIDPDNKYESKIFSTDEVYRKAVIESNRVIGCIMLGDRKNFNRINRAIATGENIIPELDSLLPV